MIEICLKYDNMHIFIVINSFNCINNHVINVIIACYPALGKLKKKEDDSSHGRGRGRGRNRGRGRGRSSYSKDDSEDED